VQIVASRGIACARRKEAKQGSRLGTFPARIGHIVNGIGNTHEGTGETAVLKAGGRKHRGAGRNLQRVTFSEEYGALRASVLDQGGEGQFEQLRIQRQQPARFLPECGIELSKQRAEDQRTGRLGFGAALANGFGETSHQRTNLRRGRQAVQRETLARQRPKVRIGRG